MSRVPKNHIIMIIIYLVVLIWSYIEPFSFITWLLEALPAIILVAVLVYLYKDFQFSTFVYFIVLVHSIVMLVGSKYTYERNPLFEILRIQFNLQRNYFDRVGHFMQGLTPALMAKELFIRTNYVKRNKYFNLLILAVVIAVSGFYELIEFTTCQVSGVPGYIVLSYQGDEFDTQWDMITALVGGLSGLYLLKGAHEKSMDNLLKKQGINLSK